MGDTIQGIEGVTNRTFFPNGMMSECVVNEKNILSTSVGDLTPRYETMDFRTKNLKSLSFYEDGSIRSVSLNEQTPISTPLGVFPAELVTFYSDGTLNSVFPLNGQIGFTWSEEDEGTLAESYTFDLPFGSIHVKVNGLRFYPDGSLKSVLFWPGQTTPINTPVGTFSGRIGVRLFESGALESFEPATPVDIDTPVGKVTAYDVAAIGVDADVNSVHFDRDGRLAKVKTSGDLIVDGQDADHMTISSKTQLGLTDDSIVKLPMSLSFEEGRVVVSDGEEEHVFAVEGNRFLAMPDFDLSGFACSGECASCAGCA